MRCRLIALFAVLFSLVFFARALPAQTRQDALRTLQTLQTRCESGFNLDTYTTALNEAETQLREFFDSREAEKNPQFTDLVERALLAYQSAFLIWKAKNEYKQDSIRSDHPTTELMLSAYPETRSLFRQSGQADARELVSFLWDKADKRISEAKRMISGKR